MLSTPYKYGGFWNGGYKIKVMNADKVSSNWEIATTLFFNAYYFINKILDD